MGLLSYLSAPAAYRFNVKPNIEKCSLKFYFDLICQISHFVIVWFRIFRLITLTLNLIYAIEERTQSRSRFFFNDSDR
ncbi:hypothetical protein C7413_12782 [Paraburkholderia silvatlantica]|nr:hypothetical protein C7411_12882 [Paraburkholderia silvatlantica]PXW30834.1 hypothetical protein C7413_12782 [Paraburkholderia silvatlantica]